MKTVQRFINRREGNHSNWAAHSVGDHDKTWKLQTHAHTLKHIPHGQEPGGNPGALRVLARASSPHTFTHALVAHQRQPRPLSHPAGLLPTSQPALWPAGTRTRLLRRLRRLWLFLFHLPAITGPGGGTRVPLPLTAIPGPFSFPLPPPSAALVFRPGHVSLLHQPLLGNLAVSFLQVSECYHFFLKLLLWEFLVISTPWQLTFQGGGLSVPRLLPSNALFFHHPRQLLRPWAPASSMLPLSAAAPRSHCHSSHCDPTTTFQLIFPLVLPVQWSWLSQDLWPGSLPPSHSLSRAPPTPRLPCSTATTTATP